MNMKKYKKGAVILLCAVISIGFCACSNKSTEQNGADLKESESTTAYEEITDSRNDENVIIDEKTAEELAYSALCETDFSDFGIEATLDDFELESCELNDGGWRREEYGYTTKVWTVTYNNKNTLCDSIYFDISEQGGALLYCGYQGD